MFLREFFAPQPIERLAWLRLGVPLAILGFLSLRFLHAGDWLGSSGFRVPRIEGGDWRQPLYLPALTDGGAWVLAVLLVVSGLAAAAGFRTRLALGCFLACLAYATFADRMTAFTVNKLGCVLVAGLLFTPCGKAYGVDAWLRRRKGEAGPSHVTWGNVRFFQVLLLALYALSGVAKLQGEWLTQPYLLWTHLHDSYQTWAAYRVANLAPAWIWPVAAQGVLWLETLAPLWFSWRRTRWPALLLALGMHGFIGLCFGPVIWFALLMGVLLLGCFAPLPWLQAILRSLEARHAPEGATAGPRTAILPR